MLEREFSRAFLETGILLLLPNTGFSTPALLDALRNEMQSPVLLSGCPDECQVCIS